MNPAAHHMSSIDPYKTDTDEFHKYYLIHQIIGSDQKLSQN